MDMERFWHFYEYLFETCRITKLQQSNALMGICELAVQ